MQAAIFLIFSATLLVAEDRLSFTRVTSSGRFQATLTPSVQPIPINTVHSWTLQLVSLGSQAAEIQELGLEGGMAGHTHGLATAPEIQPGDHPGQFQVKGLRFQMSGTWDLKLVLVNAAGVWDRAVFSVPVGIAAEATSSPTISWSSTERAQLASLSLRSLSPIPADPTNRVAGNPAAADLGKRLFFDPGLSANGKVSCATCHDPNLYFTDGRRFSIGIAVTSRNTPTVIATAYAPFLYWDGRSDSLWSQALGPLQSPDEMGSNRSAVVDFVKSQPNYRRDYEVLFGPFSSTVQSFANIGKIIAAYERTLLPAQSRFDHFVNSITDGGDLDGSDATGRAGLSDAEIAGLKIFLNAKTGCLQCHNGPLFTNQSFHNIGTGNSAGEHPDFGRIIGLQALLLDEFNCLGPFRDGSGPCPNLDFLNKEDHRGLVEGSFKVPSLRSVALTAPYMHDGRFATLEAVLEHYRKPPAGNHELRPLTTLTDDDMANLAAFLRSLTP